MARVETVHKGMAALNGDRKHQPPLLSGVLAPVEEGRGAVLLSGVGVGDAGVRKSGQGGTLENVVAQGTGEIGRRFPGGFGGQGHIFFQVLHKGDIDRFEESRVRI